MNTNAEADLKNVKSSVDIGTPNLALLEICTDNVAEGSFQNVHLTTLQSIC